jgi:hypothetical protein
VQSLGAGQQNILAPGSQNILINGLDRLEAFKGMPGAGVGGRVLFNFSDTYASLNDYSTITAKGSIFMLASGRTMGVLGAGQAYLDGASLSLAASSTLQFLLYRNGIYTDALSGPFQAGLGAPSAVQIVPMTSTISTPGKVSGAVAVQITRVRSTTGAESNVSTSSPVVIANQQSIRVGPFPSLGTNGEDRWGIYVTLPGFGTKGPFYFLSEIADSALSTIDGVARCYEIEWTDADIATTALLAPHDNNPPPAGIFACELGGKVAVIGCYGDQSLGVTAAQPGNAIACSLQGFPEAFPPTADYTLFLPEPPVHCISRAAEGYVWIFCKNSVHVLSDAGATLILQTILPNIGISAPHNACFVDGRLYMATGNGLIRLGAGGEPETQWAAGLLEARSFVAANVVLGYDANQHQMCACHGNYIYPFNTDYEKWGAPVPLNTAPVSIAGNVTAAVTVNNQLKLSVNNAGTFTLYDFNAGTTGSTWIAQSGNLDGGAAEFLKTITEVRSAVRHDNLSAPIITSRIYRVLQHGSAQTVALAKQFTNTIDFAGLQTLQPPGLNIREVKAFSFWQSAQGLNSGPVETLVFGTASGIRK